MQQIARAAVALGVGEVHVRGSVRRRGNRHRWDRGFLALRSGMRLLRLFLTVAVTGVLALGPSLASTNGYRSRAVA
jgi:hypothetical protein